SSSSGLLEKYVLATNSSSSGSYSPIVSSRRHGTEAGGFAKAPSSVVNNLFSFKCQNSRCLEHLIQTSSLGSINTTSIRSFTSTDGSPSTLAGIKYLAL